MNIFVSHRWRVVKYGHR